MGDRRSTATTPQRGAERLAMHRRFGGCVSEVPLPAFADALEAASGSAIVVRSGWAITSEALSPASGGRSRVADLGHCDVALLPAEGDFELARRFSLHVLRVDASERERIESTRLTARRVGTALISAQLAWCARVLDLLQDYFSDRQVGGDPLSKNATLRHQLGDAQRQLRFLQEWQHAAGDASSHLAMETAALGASLGRLGGGRSYLEGSLCDAAAMYALLANLYPGSDHE
jgi:hypothetical protein